jgi:hypothetical protein
MKINFSRKFGNVDGDEGKADDNKENKIDNPLIKNSARTEHAKRGGHN